MRTTDERLLDALRASDGRVEEANRLASGNTALSGASAAKMAFTTAFSAGAVLVFKAVELPDEKGELPPDCPLPGPPNLAAGYVALNVGTKIAADGARFFHWCEFAVYDQGLHATPPEHIEQALAWVAAIRQSYIVKYRKRLFHDRPAADALDYPGR
jgi:hypothetical protein